MDSLNHEQEKLVQMGSIKSTKDQALAAGFSNQGKGKKKPNDWKQQEKKKCKSSDGGLNPSMDKGKKQEKTKCTYCHKGWNPESSYTKKTMDMMAQILENNNTPLPNGAMKK